jgi:hypothetical protein
MNGTKRYFEIAHAVLALGLVALTLLLFAMAGAELWRAAMAGLNDEGARTAIECLELAAIAIVTLQIAQTLIEEEVVREAHISAPTRARRYLSRFLVVVVVALSIEGLVATFKALRDESISLPDASLLIGATALLLAGWGVFVNLNRAAEELEPEAMEEAKREDEKVR